MTHLPRRLEPIDGGSWHDSWARCMAGVTVRHHRHQLTSWPIKWACTSRYLKRHWISADPIRALTSHTV